MLLVNFECYSQEHLKSVLETEGEICGNFFCIVNRDNETIEVHDIMPDNLEKDKLILSKTLCRLVDLSGMMETEEDKDYVCLRALR